jgi:hypothetical protein
LQEHEGKKGRVARGGGKTCQIFKFGFQYVAKKKRRMIKNLYFICGV